MPDYSFIRFAPTTAKAWDLDESPEVKHQYYGQVHLKPLDRQPYRQVTNSDIPLIVGNYSAYLVDRCGNETDVTDNVIIENYTYNGIGQLKVKLSYLPDMGGELVYLKIDRYDNGTKFYYSNKFLCTAEGIEYTSRLDYIERDRTIIGDNSKQYIQSIRLQFYKHNFVSRTEIDTYYQITRGLHVNPRALEKELVEWKTQPFDGWTMKRLIRAMLGVCYINQYRSYLFEAPEYNKRELESNISENLFITDINQEDYLVVVEESPSDSLISFRVNVPTVTINDDGNYLVTQTQIPG